MSMFANNSTANQRGAPMLGSLQLSEQKCIFVSFESLVSLRLHQQTGLGVISKHMPCCIRQINYADFFLGGAPICLTI